MKTERKNISYTILNQDEVDILIKNGYDVRVFEDAWKWYPKNESEEKAGARILALLTSNS